MIRIRGRGVVYAEAWYDEPVPDDPGADVVMHQARAEPMPGYAHTPFLSLVTDLTPDEDAIAHDFDTTCRYQIRRAQQSDGLATEFITQPESRLDEFADFFDDFARGRNIWLSDRKWLAAASKAGQLMLSVATHEGRALAWHAYVIACNTAGVQYTGSSFRQRDKSDRPLVGRANRWLHWQDMLRLKQLGITRYDWGGMFADETDAGRAGINNFKRSFGPKERRSCHCEVPVTLRGRVWLPLRDVWRNRAALRSSPLRTLGLSRG